MISEKSRFLIINLLCILVACVINPLVMAQQQDVVQPNIILILADDLGYGDIAAYGGDVHTPNIDRLAREGLKFTDFHTNGANCSPTRASLLTGRYQQRMGIEGALGENDKGLGAPEAMHEITIAQYLKEAGYSTGLIGKWHLGYQPEQSPLHFGFDRFVGMLHGATDYHSHVNTFGRFDWWHDDKLVKEEGYVTDLITAHSVEFIENRGEDPFFLFVSHLAIHFPWQTPDDEPHRVEGNKYRDYGNAPLSRYGQHHPEKYESVARIMIEELDKSVGIILDKVYESGIEGETFILFASDNGGIIEASEYPVSSNGPLRGAKHSLYEGGHRVPAIAWWPGNIEMGITSDETVMTMDLLPTFLNLAGKAMPAFDSPNATDGISITPLLFHSMSLPSRTLFWRIRDDRTAVRSGNWKFLLPTDAEPELYYLATDIGEEKNLAEKFPGLVKQFTAKAVAWQNDVTIQYEIE